MWKFPCKTTLAGAAILAATVYAFAAPLTPGAGGMHGGMHGDVSQPAATHGQAFGAPSMPTMPGQDAFGAIQEIVQILDADPATDWSKVNIAALREHLIDMNEVTLHATAVQRIVDNSLVIEVSGEGRTRDAIRRMVPAHVHELQNLGWNAKAEERPNGVTLTVSAADAKHMTRLKALGFIGIMAQGAHHQPHHLMIAKGEFPMH
jgi:hypothetical protein